mmetsp:Transcript_31742/g.36663  ORF Transcript_31742/g.36663 Transcript_31742/m.36663 type:complete len:281 (+) Transcript_31742:32-874(+)
MEKTARVIIVTGANKGIGFALMKRLVNHRDRPILVLTARNESNGKKALEELNAIKTTSEETVVFHPLDVTSKESRATFAEWIKEKFGKFDVLVNNAGVKAPGEILSTYDPSDKDIDLVMGTNYHSLRELTELLLPLLSSDGKIINVSSELGEWWNQGKTFNAIFHKADFSEKDIENIYSTYREGAKNKTLRQDGHVRAPYDLSKAFLNAWTHYLLPSQLKGDQQCYTMSPGWCKTDLAESGAPLTPDDGADTIEYLIDLPYKYDANLNGKFFHERKPTDF